MNVLLAISSGPIGQQAAACLVVNGVPSGEPQFTMTVGRKGEGGGFVLTGILHASGAVAVNDQGTYSWHLIG